jgi:hypothetical protein
MFLRLSNKGSWERKLELLITAVLKSGKINRTRTNLICGRLAVSYTNLQPSDLPFWLMIWKDLLINAAKESSLAFQPCTVATSIQSLEACSKWDQNWDLLVSKYWGIPLCRGIWMRTLRGISSWRSLPLQVYLELLSYLHSRWEAWMQLNFQVRIINFNWVGMNPLLCLRLVNSLKGGAVWIEMKNTS